MSDPKKWISWIKLQAVLSALVICSCAPLPTVHEEWADPVVRGRVYDSGLSEGTANVRIYRDGDPETFVFSDAAGYFRLDGATRRTGAYERRFGAPLRMMAGRIVLEHPDYGSSTVEYQTGLYLRSRKPPVADVGSLELGEIWE